MIILFDNAPRPSFLAQWAPLIAASIALIGALVTLWVTTRRAGAEFRETRRDTYYGDARTAITEVITAAESFYRHAHVVSDWGNLYRIKGDRLGILIESTNTALQDIRRSSAAARLLVQEELLRGVVKQLATAAEDVAELVWGSIDALSEERLPELFVLTERDDRFSKFNAASGALESGTLEVLRPTVHTRSGKCRICRRN